MMNQESFWHSQDLHPEPALSKSSNTEPIVEVTRQLQRLQIVFLGALGGKPFTDNTAVGKVISPNSAQTLHLNHSNYLNNQKSSIIDSLLYFVKSKDEKKDPVEFVKDVKTYVNSK